MVGSLLYGLRLRARAGKIVAFYGLGRAATCYGFSLSFAHIAVMIFIDALSG